MDYFNCLIHEWGKVNRFLAIAAASNSTIILVLSFTKGRGVWKKDVLDIGCLALGIIGIIVWQLTMNPSFSVYMGSMIDILAVIPTIRKVYADPKSEPKMAWTLGLFAIILNLFALDSSRLVIVIYPVSVLLWHLAVLFPLYTSKSRNHLTS